MIVAAVQPAFASQHLLAPDVMRAITISLWGVYLGYLVLLLRVYVAAWRRRLIDVRYLLATLLAYLGYATMATEISWRIIFQGVGHTPLTAWVWVNPFIYLVTVAGMAGMLHARVQQFRRVLARMRDGGPGDSKNT